MKIKFIYALVMLFGFFATVSCEKKSESSNTENAAKEEDLSANDLINNPNTANPHEVPAGPLPKMTFTESAFDFGNIKQGDKVKHTFTFKNTGDAPLIIENASASCGCTVPQWPREPIAPGKEGKIEVEFNSAGKMGQQSKQISIRANTQPNITELTIKTNITE